MSKLLLSTGFDYIRQDAVKAKVILADGTVKQADLIIAANGVHSTAKEHVLVKDDANASNTGWSTMRWLVPTEELLADADTASLVEDSTQRYFMGARGGGLVWYPCRKYVPNSLLAKVTDCWAQQRGSELPLSLTVVRKLEYYRRYVHSNRNENTRVTSLLDFQAGIEPTVVMDYAKNEFSPALQAVLA